ncbi:MAG: HEPN domain-containing protein [Deltaproteobacteria bacterium]|nr:HEPN domain-containing protein [Deltaproteobacteria bacterium]
MNLERAQSSLQAARLCLQERLFDSAASRAYFAMFMMAICALENRGIKRSEWTHKGVHSDFVFNFVRGRKIVPATFASALPTAMEIRHIADYRQSGASQRQAERVVRLAGEFSERLSKEMLNASNP